MKNPAGPIAIAYRVLAHEDFDRTAQILLKLLRLFPDLRWEKEVRWERTARKAGRSWVKLGG
jgi:hypothetical protein